MKFKEILSKNPRLMQERKHQHSTISASLVTVSIVIETQKLNSDSTQGVWLNPYGGKWRTA